MHRMREERKNYWFNRYEIADVAWKKVRRPTQKN